jgi:hypothetical protein
MNEGPRIDPAEVAAMDLGLSNRAAQVYALYAFAIDYGDFDLLDSLLTEDIAITRGDTLHSGREAFLQVYRNNWEADWSAGKHYIGNVLASRQDDGLVRSRAYFQAVFIRSDRTSKVIGRYDDLLEDVDGRLLIKHKRINVEGVVDLPESAREWGGYRLWSR